MHLMRIYDNPDAPLGGITDEQLVDDLAWHEVQVRELEGFAGDQETCRARMRRIVAELATRLAV